MMSEHVYFARFGEAIKVGVSKDVERRLDEFATGNQHEGELLGVVAGDQRTEQAMHKLLKPFHVRNEWFRDCPELREILTGIVEPYEPKPPEKNDAPLSDRTTERDLGRAIAVAARNVMPKTADLAAALGCEERSVFRYTNGDRLPDATALIRMFLHPALGPPAIAAVMAEAEARMSPQDFDRFQVEMVKATVRAGVRENNEVRR